LRGLFSTTSVLQGMKKYQVDEDHFWVILSKKNCLHRKKENPLEFVDFVGRVGLEPTRLFTGGF
jgi:hypothetical protein